MFEIRDIDAKILKALLEDGRKSLAEIAQECGTTKNRIWKHHEAMEKKGIITGATIQINFSSFGYEALATLLISVEAQQIEHVMEYIGKITEIRPYRQYNNIYNIRAVTTLRNLNKLDHVKNAIRRVLPANGLRTYIWTDVRNIPENLKLSLNQKNFDEKTQPNSGATVHNCESKNKLDQLDQQIIDKLSANGRESFNKIAEEIGTSTDTVLKRYKKLRENGIMKVTIQIDPNIIGYRSILDFNIAFASPGNSFETVEALAKIPDVIIITKTSGDYDLQLTAMIRDVKQMFDIQDEIARTPGVTKIETSARKIPNKWPTPKQYISTF